MIYKKNIATIFFLPPLAAITFLPSATEKIPAIHFQKRVAGVKNPAIAFQKLMAGPPQAPPAPEILDHW